jgi:hypothetical protein
LYLPVTYVLIVVLIAVIVAIIVAVAAATFSSLLIFVCAPTFAVAAGVFVTTRRRMAVAQRQWQWLKEYEKYMLVIM